MIFKNYIVLALSVFIVSCANTKVTESWVDADHSKPYKHPMIIGVSDSQQTRQIYEKHFVEELEKINITATASYTLISSKQKMTRETVLEVMKGTDIDAVLITYLVSSDTEVKHHESPLSRGYSGDIEGSRLSATLVSTRGRTSSTEIITLKNDLYDRQTKTLIWSTQTRTVAPESIDEAITDVVDLLIDQMLSDNVI
jgi:hypothetical protein